MTASQRATGTLEKEEMAYKIGLCKQHGQELAVVRAPGSATLQRGVFYRHLPALSLLLPALEHVGTFPSVEFRLEGPRV